MARHWPRNDVYLGFSTALAALALGLWPTLAGATPCACDHTIEPDMIVVNGGMLGAMPGESVCVRGGPRPALRLQNFQGADGSPIEVVNCEGQVDINNDDLGYGLTVDGSRYVHVSGAGDDAFEYGFRVRAARKGPDYAGSSVLVGDLSSDVEVDHVEAYESGFAGFVIKTDPRCDGSANLGNFVMYNSKLHHCWAHDTGGEGLYFGSTGYGGREYTCDGMKVTLYPHEHHGADIHHNLFENTGWDGAQIGVTPVDCRFYNNIIRDVGLAGELYQQQGLQVGGASACEIHSNTLLRGPTNGLFIFGADDTTIYNNAISDFQETGIYINDQGQDLGAEIRVAHNTVLYSGGWGIAVFGDKLGSGWAYNNAVAAAGMDFIGIGGEVVDFPAMGNITADDPLAIGANVDYLDDARSPLRDASAPLPDLMVPVDRNGLPRDATPDVGAHEYEPIGDTAGQTGDITTTGPDNTSSTTDATGTSGGTVTSGGETSGASDTATGTGGATEGGAGTTATSDASATGSGGDDLDDAGCGCASDGGSPAWGLLMPPALALVRRRRGRDVVR